VNNTIKHLNDGVTMITLDPIQTVKMFKYHLNIKYYSSDQVRDGFDYMFCKSKESFIKRLKEIESDMRRNSDSKLTPIFDDCDYEEVKIDDCMPKMYVALSGLYNLDKLISRKPMRESNG